MDQNQMNDLRQIAAETASEIGIKAHKNTPTINAYYPVVATDIILAAIEKAVEAERQQAKQTVEGIVETYEKLRAAQASEPWTPEYVASLVGEKDFNGAWAIADAHNQSRAAQASECKHIYSRSMDQPYPRHCLKCDAIEAAATVVGELISTAELARIIEAGQKGGMSESLKEMHKIKAEDTPS